MGRSKNLRSWLVDRYQEIGSVPDANKRAYALFERAIDEEIISEDYEVDVYRRACRGVYQLLRDETIDITPTESEDIVKHNKALFRQNQKLTDLSNLARKEKREHARYDNLLIELNQELIKHLEKNSLSVTTKKHPEGEEHYCGIIHLSDTHFNELIRSTSSISNSYDFEVSSKRLFKLAGHAKNIFKGYGITSVLIALSGDIINSDRRRGEAMSMATNRTAATLLSAYILEQFICDINEDFNVTIASVCGNESRVNDELSYEEIVASDNYDYMIDKILRIMFRNKEGVSFANGSYNEKVVSINTRNILLLHGHTLKHGSIDREIYSKMAKYAALGANIDYVLFGHLHQAAISDLYARSGSLCGDNAYSSEGLNLMGRASQNIFIVGKKEIHGVKVDLQTTAEEGYDIVDSLAEYNAKSTSKLHDTRVIVEVVI